MTKKFDDKARNELLEQINKNDLILKNRKVKNMKVIKVDAKFARPYISTFHYSKTMPDSSKYIYAGYFGDELCGIVVYGMGAGRNQYKAIIEDIKNGEYCELTRLWCKDDSPKNTESKLISESLKMLPKEVKLVISFADKSRGHQGTIYQATNWLFMGESNPGKTMIGLDGIEKHPRLIGIYKKRHPELKDLSNKEIMDMNGWSYKESSSKFRYVYIRGNKKEVKKIKQCLKDRILPYPKGFFNNNKISDLEIIDSYNYKKEQLNIFCLAD